MTPGNRVQIDELTIGFVIADVSDRLIACLKQKGCRGFASNHEILGILQEELAEYLECVHLMIN